MPDANPEADPVRPAPGPGVFCDDSLERRAVSRAEGFPQAAAALENSAALPRVLVSALRVCPAPRVQPGGCARSHAMLLRPVART